MVPVRFHIRYDFPVQSIAFMDSKDHEAVHQELKDNGKYGCFEFFSNTVLPFLPIPKMVLSLFGDRGSKKNWCDFEVTEVTWSEPENTVLVRIKQVEKWDGLPHDFFDPEIWRIDKKNTVLYSHDYVPHD